MLDKPVVSTTLVLVALAVAGCQSAKKQRKRATISPPATESVARPEPVTATSPAAAKMARAKTYPQVAAGLHAVRGSELLSVVEAWGQRGALVNVWASWCGSCKREIPMLQRVASGLKQRGLDVIFVSVDDADSVMDAIAFVDEHQIERPTFFARGKLAPFKAALNPRWKGGLPATFLFDGDAKLRYFWGAEVFEHELMPLVERYLAGEHIDGEAKFVTRGGPEDP